MEYMTEETKGVFLVNNLICRTRHILFVLKKEMYCYFTIFFFFFYFNGLKIEEMR